MNKTINMAVIYGVIAVISLFLTIGYYFGVKKKEKLLLMIHCSVLVVNIGYFAMAVSNTLESALMANRIAYLGSVFLPLSMLLIILNVCKVQYGRLVKGLLFSISICIFLIAASQGYMSIYYKHVSIEFINGAAKLVKEYGPMHMLYYIYLFTYFGAMVGVIFYSAVRKNSTPHKLAVFLAAVVLGNVGIWFVEQMIDVDFEFLSVSYILTELLMVLLYSMLQDGTISATAAEQDASMENEVVIDSDEVTSLPEALMQSDAIYPELEQLTAREKEVLSYILKNKKRKDIAEELSVSENTIKKHTSHIFSKLEVTNRAELFEKYCRRS